MSTQSEVREYLLDELRRDFIGPQQSDEELTESPVSHYMAGILYPPDTNMDAEEDNEGNEIPEEDEGQDIGTLMATSTNPSALGMTFTVKKGEKIKVILQCATYFKNDDKTTRNQIWKRQRLELPDIIISTQETSTNEEPLLPGLFLFYLVRSRGDRSVITLSLVNKRRVPKNERPDQYCFFQPEIRVESPDPGKAIFLPRYGKESILGDYDRALNELLFRHTPEYAVGHGCAALWQAKEGENATSISTCIIPAYEVLQLSPDFSQPLKAQEMLFLSEAKKEALINSLMELVQNYRKWIADLNITDVPSELNSVAMENIVACNEAADRMEKGIAWIKNDPVVFEAFQLANRAILFQRARAQWIKKNLQDRPSEPTIDSTYRWRPFQLAFILLTLSGIVDPNDLKERSIADLLWFPTGGGKTEAYLGLTAFTIFLRRLRDPKNPETAGVTVLMRYTLRLLTIQQFQRAASLILACESIRREDPVRLGNSSISAGLWVGGSATPNSLKDAGKALADLMNGERVLEGNPYQIQTCPWCGTKITPRNYKLGVTMVIKCPNNSCEFAEKLPLFLVDEDIYTQKPSLLIGTVDKFARLPWLAESSAIFGRTAIRNRPPELIIQDELHLITGPLGTLVGLYETAVDILCQNGNTPPKVIASTATIRRADEQTRGLFNRELRQFPPPGIDSRDTFFSHQVPASDKPGRCFVGIHAPGRSMKTALLRVYAVLLQKIKDHHSDSRARDPYWTLVGYFNSLRELGGAVRLVEDDVRDRMKLLANREHTQQREILKYPEVNSRMGADQIPILLEDMAKTMDDTSALDVLLATNMISVGIDVDRLGLMVVTGQPKMTSEYIQATSRVGRQFPGLIVTVYNWTRPRDRSHYERFNGYHSAIYSHVEPVSVTPFSGRARDRGLHGVFITLVRHLLPKMTADVDAANFNPDDPAVKRIISQILQRVESIDPGEVDETRQELENICLRWEKLTGIDELHYKPEYGKSDSISLMDSAEKSFVSDSLIFPTLNSLRDVEGESGIFYLRK